MTDFNFMPEVNICLLLFSTLVTMFLLIGAVTSRARYRLFMKGFVWLLVLHIFTQLGEAGIWLFQGSLKAQLWLKLCAAFSYGFGTLLVAVFTYCLLGFIREKKRVSMLPAHIMMAVCAVSFLFDVSSIWNGLVFVVNMQGYLIDGPYGFAVYLFDICTFIAEIVIIVYYRKFFQGWGFVILFGYCILQLATMFLEDIWYPVPMYLAVTLSMILIFLFFHEELARQLVVKEKELAESRIAIMVSQIQPHFLYNALNAIYCLCDKDVKLVKQAISDFSEYLQHSLSSINRTTPVHFSEELDYIRIYLQLEQLRFGEELNLIYHIETENFMVPALSVQPLVENAVKHGICGREGGGTIVLSAREGKGCFEVIVSDNGAGFDPKKKPSDGKLHIGLQNVTQRVQSMCGGTLIIDSAPGKGTTVTLRVPKERKDEDTCRR